VNKRDKKKSRPAQKQVHGEVDLEAFQVFQHLEAAINALGDNPDEDPTYEDSDIDLIPRPIRRARRRGRQGGGVAIWDLG